MFSGQRRLATASLPRYWDVPMICEVASTYFKKVHRQMRMKAMSTKARYISTFRSYRTTSSPNIPPTTDLSPTPPRLLHYPPLPIPRQHRRASPLTTISPSRNAGPNPSPTKPTPQPIAVVCPVRHQLPHPLSAHGSKCRTRSSKVSTLSRVLA